MPHENLTRAEARARAAVLSEVHYDVALDLTRGDETFGSHVTISFECSEADTRTFVDLTAEQVERAILNGEPLGAGEVQPTRVLLPGLRSGRNQLELIATMAYQHVGKGLSLFRDPTDDRVYLHSQFEPFDAHLVYACFDQPDLKATFDFTVDAPEGWVVVSNAPVVSAPAEGEAGRWEFATTPLLSTYFTAIVAGGYAVVRSQHDGIDLGLYVRSSLAEYLDPDEVFEITAQGLDFFAEAFGMPYPFGKYDQLFVPEFQAGAMENPGCITFSETHVFRSKVTEAQRERRAETILHEMAHMWFGDLVTMRWWDDLWLNESFATFMAMLAQATATRFENAWVTFLDSDKAWAKYQDQLPTTHPIADATPDVESVHQNFDGITYAKGASVLRQLVAWVGQDEFLEGCRRYFDKHAYGNAELRDFLGALADASGRDLDAWSDEWLRTVQVNRLAADYRLDADGRIVRFAILQTAPDAGPTLRRHRIAVGVYDLLDGDLRRIERVETDIYGARTEVPELKGRPGGAVVLVNDDDLTYAKSSIDERSMANLGRHLGQFVEPLPRALVWSSTWDMVRDAELPTRRYVELVISNVATESEVGVLQRLLLRALAAVDRYGDPANRDTLAERLAEHARSELDRAEPGSGHQLVWARHWARCARRGPQAADVRRVLSGDLEIEGLEVDTELRWAMVVAQASTGELDDAVIDDAYTSDPNRDVAERMAASARTARPTAAAKQEAFHLLLHDPQLSLTMSRQLWDPFHEMRYPELAEAFVEPYFAALSDIWAERSLDWAMEFTQGMYPHPVADQRLVDATDAHLERDGLPGPLRRELLEQRDTVLRTMRARAVDIASG